MRCDAQHERKRFPQVALSREFQQKSGPGGG
jgi:hypothetical protein